MPSDISVIPAAMLQPSGQHGGTKTESLLPCGIDLHRRDPAQINDPHLKRNCLRNVPWEGLCMSPTPVAVGWFWAPDDAGQSKY